MHSKVLIVEDEQLAQEHLQRLLRQIQPDIQVLDCLSTITQSVDWLQTHQADLIFMDIHLADGLSFSIFEKTSVQTPIIFTTAYDEYALKAFKVNSVDYLLKPIDEDDLCAALEKFAQRSAPPPAINLEQLLQTMRQPPPNWQERFLVHRGERLMSVLTDQIAYFEGEDRYVYLVKTDGTRYIVDYRLSDLVQLLNPAHFFRLNRSFIAHFSAINGMVAMSKSRIKVDLLPITKRPVIVSTENCQEFKNWLNH
jgi:DNA-binding LytR/AlgR family response regulator